MKRDKRIFIAFGVVLLLYSYIDKYRLYRRPFKINAEVADELNFYVTYIFFL
jgi:hypothetical protein